MEITAVNYDNIDTFIGNAIVRLGELDRGRVFNALSVRGPEIEKILQDGSKTSFDVRECFAVFEIVEDKDNENNSVIPGDDIEDTIMSYNVNIKIYGATCHTVAQKILSRLRTINNISYMRDNGIYMNKTTFPESVNEFINQTMWQRCDFSINISARFTYENKDIQVVINNIPEVSMEGITITKVN